MGSTHCKYHHDALLKHGQSDLTGAQLTELVRNRQLQVPAFFILKFYFKYPISSFITKEPEPYITLHKYCPVIRRLKRYSKIADLKKIPRIRDW